jgi:hypothetical protein
MMHDLHVQYDERIFGDTMLTVNKIPTRHMRCAERGRVMATLDFLDDSPTARQADLILDGGKTVASYDVV